jgi:hypothetical protein
MITYPEKFQIVIHSNFGGFSMNIEIAEWLRDYKGWRIFSKEDNTHDCIQQYGLEVVEKSLFESLYVNGMYKYFRGSKLSRIEQEEYEIKFRMHPDFIECIEELQEKYKDLPLRERYYKKIFDFSIKIIEIKLKVTDYYDGKECINIESFVI